MPIKFENDPNGKDIAKELEKTERELHEFEEEVRLNFAGRMAKTFLHNPLTPIIAGFVLVLGIFAFILTPKEENPQIS